MGELINLRAARKRRARAQKEASAEQNRIRHGRSSGERHRQRSEKDAAERHLDGHRRDGEPGQN